MATATTSPRMVLAANCLLLASCFESPSSSLPMVTTVEQQIPNCTLQVSASYSSPTVLQLHYKVHNRTAKALYLFNQFWIDINADQQFEILPNMVNVQLRADRVTVGKAVVPVPDDMEVEKRYTPCLSRVAPHGDYEETIQISVPLSPFTWYENQPWAKAPIHQPLFFELGYLVVSPQGETQIRRVATSQGPAFYLDTEPEHQSIISAGPLLPQVAVFSQQ